MTDRIVCVVCGLDIEVGEYYHSHLNNHDIVIHAYGYGSLCSLEQTDRDMTNWSGATPRVEP